MTITTREQLREHIHSIHDFIRNHGAGYGMTAMKIFNIFYGLKIIEKLINDGKFKELEMCKFSDLVKLANSNDDYEGYKLIKKIKDIKEILCDCDLTTDILFFDIPTNLQGDVYSYIVNAVNDIPVSNNHDEKNIIDPNYDVDLSGKVYEYFIGRDLSAISELGAYFTSREITNYIMDKIKPTINIDGTVKMMVDPFGGSGGFTLSYTKYIRDNNSNKNINWSVEHKKITHCDMNEDVVKIAAVEFFALIGQFPDREMQFMRCNSFTREFCENILKDFKYDYVLSNPPYGGDKNKKSSQHQKIEKVIDYVKTYLNNIEETLKVEKDEVKLSEIKKDKKIIMEQYERLKKELNTEKLETDKKKVNQSSCSLRIRNFCKKHKIDNANDKEACSLILLMELLAENGVCVGVLKEGVFFDSKYKNLRKILVENYNVKHIVSIPSDQFENTMTKTSIIFFENTKEKTSVVTFYDLMLIKEETDVYGRDKLTQEILLLKNKDDIIGAKEIEITKATLNDIINNDYTFSPKKYDDNVVECSDDYKMVKLGEILKYKPKSKRKASEHNENGIYNFYTSSDKIKKCDYVDYKDELCLIIGNGGKGSLFMDKNFSCSADNFICQTEPKYTLEYMYYSLIIMWDNLIKNTMQGSTLTHINKENFNNYKIPVPKDDDKLKQWTEKISKPYNGTKELEQKLRVLEGEVQTEVKRITEEEDCDVVKLENISTFNDDTYDKKYNNVKYIDLSCVDRNTIYKTEEISQNDLPSRGKRMAKIGDIIFATVRPYQRHIAILNKSNYCENNVFSTGFCIIRTTYPIYIYNILIDEKTTEYYVNNSHGSTYPVVDVSVISNTKIKLPKNKDLITKLQSKFDEIEKLQILIAESANEYKTLISQLKEEISLKTTKKINENNESKNDKIKANTQQKTEQNDDIIVVKPKNKKRNNGTKTDVKVDDQNIEQNK